MKLWQDINLADAQTIVMNQTKISVTAEQTDTDDKALSMIRMLLPGYVAEKEKMVKLTTSALLLSIFALLALGTNDTKFPPLFDLDSFLDFMRCKNGPICRNMQKLRHFNKRGL